MIFEVKNGSFSYSQKSEKLLLNDININVKSGDILAVLGPNGAGKTTLIRCLCGFLKWNTGESLLDGKSISTIPYRRLWKRLAYVPQAKAPAVSLTVFEMVLLGRGGSLNMFSKPSAEDIQKTENVLERLKISHLRDKKCTAISGGELQLVLIARALVGDPELLILDEPESNLDFRNQLIILDLLTALTKDGMACIFNTHYPSHALQRANKSLLVSKKGGYVFGDTSDILNEETIGAAFGVKVLIGEFEANGRIIRDVLPLETTEKMSNLKILTITSSNPAAAEKINNHLHEYRHAIMGRIGSPHPSNGSFVIKIILNTDRCNPDEFTRNLKIILNK